MKVVKKIFGWSVELGLLVGLLYNEQYALAVVAAYLVWMNYRTLQHVDFLRALVHVTNTSNEVKLAALTAAIPQETLDRVALRVEADKKGWESLRADAKKIGLTLQTVEERRRRY